MTDRRLLAPWLIILDSIAVGIGPLVSVALVYMQLLTTSPGIRLPGFMSIDLAGSSLFYWYIPAELLGLAIFGIFSSALQILNILALVGAVGAWYGNEIGGRLLVLTIIVVGLIEIPALFLIRFYSHLSEGNFDSNYILLTTRALFAFLLIGLNLWTAVRPRTAEAPL